MPHNIYYEIIYSCFLPSISIEGKLLVVVSTTNLYIEIKQTWVVFKVHLHCFYAYTFFQVLTWDFAPYRDITLFS